jgi:hypothetical protein
MPTKPKSKRRAPVPAVLRPGGRKYELQALKRAHRLEKQIQLFTRKYRRELQRSNDMVQSLAIDLASRARNIETMIGAPAVDDARG